MESFTLSLRLGTPFGPAAEAGLGALDYDARRRRRLVADTTARHPRAKHAAAPEAAARQAAALELMRAGRAASAVRPGDSRPPAAPQPAAASTPLRGLEPRLGRHRVLADDPGAGKTIMAGLLIKELIARGDLERCLIVCPGSLAEQWQDELYRRFQLPFEILTNDKLEAARTRNWFLETDLVIARLDKLSRDEDVQQKLQAPDAGWDLVVCDEAHKLSATFFGGEVKYTKRYRLGQLLSGLTRHFLLMTATPHNGKEQDFQLFLALLDGDRFEGRFRDGVHAADVSDLMRRMVKERLLKFDGKPLFPERIAYTVPYRLSDEEAHLYMAVTDYVREEFNRAEALANARRAGTVGFALTILAAPAGLVARGDAPAGRPALSRHRVHGSGARRGRRRGLFALREPVLRAGRDRQAVVSINDSGSRQQRRRCRTHEAAGHGWWCRFCAPWPASTCRPDGAQAVVGSPAGGRVAPEARSW